MHPVSGPAPSIPRARLGTMQLGSGAGNGYGGQKNPGAPQWHGMTLTSFGLWGRGGTNLRGLGQWQPLSAGQEGALSRHQLRLLQLLRRLEECVRQLARSCEPGALPITLEQVWSHIRSGAKLLAPSLP